MSEESTGPIPTEINLHHKSRALEVAFDDGQRFQLPCEYLRVFSPAAEVKVAENRGEVITGCEEVSIDKIEPVGNYAIQLYFDDGHNSGIYSWQTLYSLGKNQEKNWSDYLQRLSDTGYQRRQPGTATVISGPRSVKLLYFVNLPDDFGIEHEVLQLTREVQNVDDLLHMLAQRGDVWKQQLLDRSPQVTVNKQFAESGTVLQDKDEVAIVPTAAA